MPVGERPAALRYVETSALLAALLEGDASVATSLLADGPKVTSALTIAEAHRAVRRAVTSGRVSAGDAERVHAQIEIFRRRSDVMRLSDDIVARAGQAFPVEPVRTLEALHLASALALEALPGLVTIVTRDARLAANARALGFGLE